MQDPAGARPAPQVTAEQRAALLETARNAIGRAYAPYSRFHVGAAVLTEAGNVYSGCNVENASYGLTNCAERTAIFAAVAAEGPQMRLRAVAVLSDPREPCAPCGACRQVIFEFGRDALVMYQGRGTVEEACAADLLPCGFSF